MNEFCPDCGIRLVEQIKKYILTLIFFITSALVTPVYAEENGNQFTKLAGFELNTVTLSEIIKQWGQTELVESGNAGDYVAEICYRFKEGNLYFLSDEMGGPDHNLQGFNVRGRDITANCAKPPKNQLNLELKIAGIHLGLTKTEFENLAPIKVKWQDDTGYILFNSKQPMTQKEISKFPEDTQKAIKSRAFQDYFEVTIQVIGRFEGNILKEFTVWKDVSM